MSRSRGGAILGIALLAGAVSMPQNVGAQDPTEAELIQRIEALLPQYEAAYEALDARRRANREAELERLGQPTRVDTVRVGPMNILSFPAESDAARDLFTDVWRERFPEITESASLRDAWFVFRWRVRFGNIDVEPSLGEESVGVDVSPVWAPTRAHASTLVADAIARVAIQDFPEDSPMRAWLHATSYPTGESAYRALATGTSPVVRACMTGEISACMASLGFGLGAASDQLSAWFTDEDRHRMVDDEAVRGRLDRDDPSYRRCVEENDVRACVPILAELDWVTSPPGTNALRAHLLWFAAREGGAGAWQRALERRDAPMPEVLAGMGGRPIEQLVGEWRSHVLAQRPNVQAGLGGRGTRALLWSLVFAALALRSTRWRLA